MYSFDQNLDSMGSFSDKLVVRPNHEIFFRVWEAEIPKGMIVISHGLGEHSGRYERLAEKFIHEGYSMIAYDKGGHGKSSGKKGCIPDIEVYFEEIDHVLGFCAANYSGLPLVLYGQSMGTPVGLAYVLRNPDSFSAVIASSGWIRLVKEPSVFTVKMAAFLGKFLPCLTLSNGLDPKQISTLEEEAILYSKDPLVHGRISLGLGNGIFGLVDMLDNYSGTFPVPLLIMHSEDDPITAWAGSRDLASRLEGNVSFWSFKDTYHELHHDKEADDIFRRQLAWLDGVLS